MIHLKIMSLVAKGNQRVIWLDLVRVQLSIRQLVQGMQRDVCCSNIIQVPPAVYPQICADRQPKMALPLAAPVLHDEPSDGAPLAYPGACIGSARLSEVVPCSSVGAASMSGHRTSWDWGSPSPMKKPARQPSGSSCSCR